ncbi:hypothetical protein [Methylobacterium nonmethylotrophicum]|uniref:Uncharacterized protein n=1 Tax=Methylobacterium nonmethylotrophicum TaxID=1141884 RepID=A0A4Z0NR55_9HYPH|nr:hypothetical protein [Methylobacterium nonmethylotrophicum]TGD98920.1 hypothetical protein EU555_13480 [Methylobacterium nonmethylotrophicum]
MTGPRPTPVQACRRCLLPATLPGLAFTADGLCDLCAATGEAEAEAERVALRARLDALYAAHRGTRPYAAIVAYSGGKDSSYTLKHLVEEQGLRCLAITVDNGFLSAGTLDNCRAVCAALDVDLVVFTPSRRFTERMYRASVERDDLHAPAAVKRASAICSSCITLINTHMLQRALELRVPIVAGGYLGGQVPRDGAVMTLRPGRQARIRTALVNRFVGALGEGARRYFDLPGAAEGDPEVVVVNPMLGVALSEEAIKAALAPLGWRQPTDTGLTSTNCRLNDLGVYLHSRRHGFHPYAMEIAEQLRGGTISREAAARKLGTLPGRGDVAWMAERIGLPADAL